jgi:2-polyprenyl-6-methoxyphenol hydroxylase-like FAD-dependent oxidoreductase
MSVPEARQTGGGSNLRVVIAGAGIGGIVAATALRQAGIEVVVAEKAGDLRHVQVGNGIHLTNNGFMGLRQLGLAERVKEVGAVLDKVELCTAAGDVLAVGDMAALERELGVPSAGVLRSDLHSALASSLDERVLRLGAGITGFEQDDAGVTVRLADGTEERCDVLVGADGYRSSVREQLSGDEVAPYFTGMVIAQAAVKGWESAPVMRMHFGRGKTFGYHPVRGGTYWYFIYVAPEGGITPPGGLKPELLKFAEGFADPAHALIDATPESLLSQTDLLTSRPRDRWGRGRITLLGDAAHAMTPFGGQGTSQAIEDALALTKCLSAEGDVASRLSKYEAERTVHTQRVVKVSLDTMKMARLKNPIAVAIRNWGIRRFHPKKAWQEHREIVSHTV